MHEEDVAVNQHLSRELDDIIGLISLNEGCSLSLGCRIKLIKSQQKPACGGVSWLLSKNQLTLLSSAGVCQVPTKKILDQLTEGKNYDGKGL